MPCKHNKVTVKFDGDFNKYYCCDHCGRIMDGQEYAYNKRVAELEAALLDAIESYAEYSQYAGEYLCKKHNVAEHIKELRALLSGEDRK